MKSIINVGADVHKVTFSLCAINPASGEVLAERDTSSDAKAIKRFIDSIISDNPYLADHEFVVGYEAGCLGYSLARALMKLHISCRILATSTMKVTAKNKVKKNDHMDARMIAANMNDPQCKQIYIPGEEDEAMINYVRCLDDLQKSLKACKQQIRALILRLGKSKEFEGKRAWTIRYIKWLRELTLDEVNREVLNDYLEEYDHLTDHISRMEARLEEKSKEKKYDERVKELSCFKGIKMKTAMVMIVNTVDFDRFPTANSYAAYLGLNPGEQDSGGKHNGTGITKMGNSHMRKAMVEAVNACLRSRPGYKTKAIQSRQKGIKPEIVSYADKGSDRIIRKYGRLIRRGVPRAKAVTACAREMACFVWGMMTGHIQLSSWEMQRRGVD